jgi:hypothetical protein
MRMMEDMEDTVDMAGTEMTDMSIEDKEVERFLKCFRRRN